MPKYNILLLEDDASLGMVLQEHLQLQGFEVTLCVDGEQGLVAYRKDKYDICLVDIMMPKKDGFSFAEDIRRTDQKTPLIFLTAKSLKEDKIHGFQVGCDDYITKPFSIEELMLRIEAVLRRTCGSSPSDSPDSFRIGSYTFNYQRQLLVREKKQKKLTPKESDLLRLLCMNMNKTVLRADALQQVWDDDSYFTGRSMDVYISKLRKYFKDDPGVQIMGIHGKGFRLIVQD
jgi:DNA-binding response OmpR family regulator